MAHRTTLFGGIITYITYDSHFVPSVYVTNRTLQKDTELVSDVDNDSCTGQLKNYKLTTQRYSHYLKKTEKER